MVETRTAGRLDPYADLGHHLSKEKAMKSIRIKRQRLLCGVGVMLVLASPVLAQAKEAKLLVGQQALLEPRATTCHATFTSGSGDASLRWCVTINGNLLQ